MNKEYMDELRAKRAANLEARNVQICVKLWYARKACRKLTNIELEMYTQYVDVLRAKRAANSEAKNVQNCEIMTCTRSAVQNN